MSYFLPTFFQKRILRYALSRLELLDTETLDLEKLDIAWGRKSTVELKDVGLHTKVNPHSELDQPRKPSSMTRGIDPRSQKLSALLDLPSSLAITSAQILFLRLTIPADLYKTGIAIEVRGVRVLVDVDLRDQESTQPEAKRGFFEKPSKHVKADRPRSSQSHVHDPGGSPLYGSSRTADDHEDVRSGGLPTTVDLAQSFLETGPMQEKVELQASVTSSQYLDQSLMGEEKDVGIGDRYSLPVFLADFLKGVGDRVELKIQDVEVELTLKLGRLFNTFSGSDTSDRPENVSFRLAINNVCIEGAADCEQEALRPESRESINLTRQGSRRITLFNVEIMVISEASVFADLSRSTAPSSLETNQVDSLTGAHSSQHPDRDSSRDGLQKSMDKKEPQGAEIEVPRRPKETIYAAGVMDDEISQADSQRHPTTTVEYDDRRSPELTYSDITMGQKAPKPFVASGESPHLVAGNSRSPVNSFELPRTSHFPSPEDTSPTTNDAVGPALTANRNMEFSSGSISQAQQSPSHESPNILPFNKRPEHSSPDSENSSPGSEDLAESRIFTHEEASLYMSAISQASNGCKNLGISLPGDWNSSSTDHVEDSKSPTSGKSSSMIRRFEEVRTTQLHGSDRELGPLLRDEDTADQSHNISAAQASSGDIMPTVVQAETKPVSLNSNSDSSSSQESETFSSNTKSSLTVLKRIISIDMVTVMLPLSSKSGHIYTEPPAQPLSANRQATSGGFSTAPMSNIIKSSEMNVEPRDNSCFSVDLEKLQILSDLGLTRMMVLLIQRLNTSRRSGSSEVDNKATFSENSEKTLRLTMKKGSWQFVDTVKAMPLSNSCDDGPRTGIDYFSGDFETLLRAKIENLEVKYSNTGVSSTTQFTMGKFFFGYCSDNIISFDSGLKMRESTRDILAPVNDDIVIKITKSPETFGIDLTTIPLHIALDLRRLDETFSWFGGFSSILGLGNSMMSTMTIIDVKPKTARSVKSTRGVHFESPDSGNPSQPESTHIIQKVTARVGGLVFDLKGAHSSLRFESSAMKMVSRAEGFGLQVDRLKCSSPYYRQDSPIAIQLTNSRLEYLSTPKEVDLARLLALLSPSKSKDARDDDILLETLLSQRRQGAVVRATVDSLEGDISDSADLRCLPSLAEDLKKLSSVTKYLPEDERPGVLVLGLIRDFQLRISVNSRFGMAHLSGKSLEGVHVTFPNLMALGIKSLHLYRNDTEELIGTAIPSQGATEYDSPTVMARFIGNELEPTAKIRIQNLRLEYHVSTIMAIMGLEDDSSTDLGPAEMIASERTVTSSPTTAYLPPRHSSQNSTNTEDLASHSKTVKFDITFRDSIIGLNPRHSSARCLFILTDTRIVVSKLETREANAVLEAKKASIMIVDNAENVTPYVKDPAGRHIHKGQIECLSEMGYVSVGSISAAKATAHMIDLLAEHGRAIDLEIRDNLFVLETCADSTQTLLHILNGLKPPVPSSTEPKYMTEVVSIQDMLASFTGDAFATTSSSPKDGDLPLGLDEGDLMDDEVPQNLEFVSSFYNPDRNAIYDGIADSMLDDDLESLAIPSKVREIGDKNLLESFQDQAQVAPGDAPLDFQEDHFGTSSSVETNPHKAGNKPNLHKMSRGSQVPRFPLRVQVRDVHVIWNLFDGYDWQNTRDAISQAVEDVKSRANDRLAQKDRRKSFDLEEDEESVIGDFLFNSIYIGIPANRDPKELTRQVNRDLDDLASESGSDTTSLSSGSPSRRGYVPGRKSRSLRLERSRSHKMTFELKGVSADMVVFPPGSREIQSSIDIRMQDLEIFDHVPTSTWKKFATYMHDAGERQSGTSMIHLNILNVKPIPHLAASEIILKVGSIHHVLRS